MSHLDRNHEGVKHEQDEQVVSEQVIKVKIVSSGKHQIYLQALVPRIYEMQPASMSMSQISNLSLTLVEVTWGIDFLSWYTFEILYNSPRVAAVLVDLKLEEMTHLSYYSYVHTTLPLFRIYIDTTKELYLLHPFLVALMKLLQAGTSSRAFLNLVEYTLRYNEAVQELDSKLLRALDWELDKQRQDHTKPDLSLQEFLSSSPTQLYQLCCKMETQKYLKALFKSEAELSALCDLLLPYIIRLCTHRFGHYVVIDLLRRGLHTFLLHFSFLHT